ncbi:FtsX-like permease family protein [Microbacterium sp. bgisy189]|uniref:FtsX-like permease family protein n=1 Tax=Microbacterium sp. bgisy189 TaxID=3413798 RepID=UPI003EBB683E
MTGVLERPKADAAAVSSGERRRMRSRLRVDLRLARRQVMRTKGSSLLVGLLVAIPVAGMVAAAVYWQSHVPTRAQEVGFELGGMASRVEIVGGEDPSRWQAVDSTWDYGVDYDQNTGQPLNPERPMPENPDGVIPAASTVYPVEEYGSVVVETATGIGRVDVTAGDVWAPAFEGRFVDRTGETPTGPDEAMVTPGLLDRLGVGIGAEVVLTDGSPSFTITGTIRRADMRPSEQMLFLPAAAGDVIQGNTIWFVEDWQPTLAELADANVAGFMIYARDFALDPPAGARTTEYRADTQQGWAMLVTGSIVGTFAGYLVVLLAGAAFAVAARRQQRTLAVAGSVGADKPDIFRIVVLQGTVLGVVGGVVGAAVGVGLAAGVIAATDDGAVGGFWGAWGFNVPWMLVIGILVFATVVGTIAAIAPARSATNGDVLGALRGSRRPATLNTKRPLAGVGMIVGGLAATVGSSLLLVALMQWAPQDYGNPLWIVLQFGIVLGPIVFQIGVLVAGHWIISMIAKVLSRLGLAARIAARDAAANPSRVVPAFAAIAACVFIASFALSAVAITSASSTRNYYWSAPLGSLSVNMWSATGDEDAALEVAREVVATFDADGAVVVSVPKNPVWDEDTGAAVDPEAPVFSIAWPEGERCAGCLERQSLANGQLYIVEPDDVVALLGADVSTDALDAYRSGAALAVGDEAEYLVSAAGTLSITEWTSESSDAYHDALGDMWNASNGGDPTDAQLDALPGPDRVHAVDAVHVDLGYPVQHGTLIAPETAEGIGIDPAPSTLIALFDEVQSTADYDRMMAEAESAPVPDGALHAYPERGPESSDPWLWLIAGAAVVLVVGAGAVCLGLARFERRPDDATLTAVGGSTGIRRRINAWQAAIIVGIGAVVGTIAGQIPMWGIAQTSTSIRYWQDAPWLWLAVLAVGLPVLVTVVSWLVPPRKPELTRRTAIA